MQAFKVRPHPGEVDPNVHLSIDTERIYVIEGAYRLALQNYRELAVLDNAIFGPKVAETLSGLASFHHYKPDVLDTLNSLGRIYSMHRLDATIRSEDDPFNALMWALLEPDSSKRRRDQQRNKAQLGHAKAEEEVIYREALTICWELAQIDPATYLPKVADELKNLKECCGHAEIVLPGFQELLQRYKALAVKPPATYLVLAAETAFELSMFGERTALEREQAESEYRTILASIQGLAILDPGTYLPIEKQALRGFATICRIQCERETRATVEAGLRGLTDGYRKLGATEPATALAGQVDALGIIEWKGRDSARQDKLFKDFFLLAESDTDKRRCLYVNDRAAATRCFMSGRTCKSLLGRSANTGTRFASKYPASMRACQYFSAKQASVEIIELPDFDA